MAALLKFISQNTQNLKQKQEKGMNFFFNKNYKYQRN